MTVLKATFNYFPRWLIRTLWFVVTVSTWGVSFVIALAGQGNGVISGTAAGYCFIEGLVVLILSVIWMALASEYSPTGLFTWGYVKSAPGPRFQSFIARSEAYRKRKETSPEMLIAEMERDNDRLRRELDRMGIEA